MSATARTGKLFVVFMGGFLICWRVDHIGVGACKQRWE
jgi:hypothetical protein